MKVLELLIVSKLCRHIPQALVGLNTLTIRQHHLCAYRHQAEAKSTCPLVRVGQEHKLIREIESIKNITPSELKSREIFCIWIIVK